MNEKRILADQSARDLALTAFDTNIFIDAGAGTGKTRTLVDRIVNQISKQGEFSITNLAAITFTEKAGAELRTRFRQSLVEASGQASSDLERQRIGDAVNLLDTAPIGTIHSFCKRILSDNSIQADLPVGFQIASEAAGPMHRIIRARRIADEAWLKLPLEVQNGLQSVNFSASHMEDIVVALDEKFATVNEINLDKFPTEQSAEYQYQVYEFIKLAIIELKNDQQKRRSTGEIEFDDLLLMTRDLLRDNPSLAREIGMQFKVMLVDEFQDTDPVQWEIIKLITVEPGDSSPRPGSLILVGDPKQSIYRFRNADIHTFLEAKGNYSENQRADQFGQIVDLTTNFRSTKGILDFVNWLFADSQTDASNPLYLGVDYKGLGIIHEPVQAESGPSVRVISAPEAKTAKITQVEFDWTAKEIRKAIDDKYLVTEEIGKGVNKSRQYRSDPATFKDVCILIPVRGHIDELLRALAKHEIPFRSSDPRIVFARPLVRGLINALRVVAQTDDDMALWAALKSPLFAHTDEELFKYVSGSEVKSNWSIDGGATGSEPSVLKSMEKLFATRLNADLVSPNSVINYLVYQNQIFEKLRFDKNGEFEASAIRMLLAHASQWENEGGHGLLEYLDSLEAAIDEKSRSSLPMPDDTETNSVQIMTIHASKGLEFPITVVSGLSSIIGNNYDTLLVSRSQEIEFYLGRNKDKTWIASDGYQELKEKVIAEEDRLELNRLLYVGVTRAQDHLILSAVANPGEVRARSNSIVERLNQFKDGTNLPFEWASYDIEHGADPEYTEQRLEIQSKEFDRDYSDQIASSKLQRLITPSSKGQLSMKIFSSLKQSEEDGEEISDESYYSEAGTSADFKKARQMAAGGEFGNAVHSVMEKVINFGAVPDEETLEGFIWSEGLENAGRLRDAIKAILKTDIITEALQSTERYPELFLSLVDPSDEVKMIEGFADLVFKSGDGFVLVDYKTDKEEYLKQRWEHYQEQLGKYSIILEQLTGTIPSRLYILWVNEGAGTEDEPLTTAQSLPLEY